MNIEYGIWEYISSFIVLYIQRWISSGSLLLEVLEDGIDVVEGLVYLLSDLGPCQHDLATDEDEEHDPGLDHPVDQTGEQLGLVT